MVRASGARDAGASPEHSTRLTRPGLMDIFSHCFALLIGEEGGYTVNRADPGNWTGGKVGSGTCAGTKYGLSAASFPTLTIASLTLAQAQGIYRSLYWGKIAGDQLPAPLALLAFDAAVNNGVSRATHWLQEAAGCTADGVLGPATLQAIDASAARDADGILVEFQAQRMIYMASLPTWKTFGLGWARRLCTLPFQALPLFSSKTAKAA